MLRILDYLIDYKLNDFMGREVFKFKSADISRDDVRELVDEAVGRVVEFIL
jgi:hypothetical protein